MSEPTYSFTLTETERAAFAKVLGGLVTKLLNAPVQIDGAIAAVQAQTRLDQVPPVRPAAMPGVQCGRCGAPLDGKGHCPICTNPPARLADQSGTDHARAILSPPAAAQSTPQAPIALRDRWARDRKGNTPSGPPKDAEPIIVRISQTVRADTDVPRLKVSWPRQEGQGYITATCWDEKLFPAIMQREALGQPTTLHVREVRGYLNIVGVRA